MDKEKSVMEQTLAKIQFLANRAFQQSLILTDFIEGHCSKAEALLYQIEMINDDLKEMKELTTLLGQNRDHNN